MEMTSTRRITLYTRPGCHLCEDAADLLERLATRLRLEIVEVNILGDVDVYERYKYSIPVVALASGETMSAPIREADLLRWLT